MKARTVFASLNPVTLRGGRAVRSLVLLGVTCALLLALSAGSASATTLSTTSDPLPGSTFQGGDGNQTAEGTFNSVPNTDWESLSPGDITTNPDPATNDSCFVGGTKQLDPGDWAFQADPACDPGVSPSKDNILAGWSSVDQPGDTFLYLAFTREAQTGNTYLAFELNQRTDAFPGHPGVPCRTTGDLLVSYQINSGGSPPNVDIVIHKWTTVTDDPSTETTAGDIDTGCALTGTVQDLNPSTDDAEASVNNDTTPIDNFLPTDPPTATFAEGTFGEVALNLSDIFRNQLNANPCFNFGQVSMESHSSTSFTSDLKDYVGPVPILIANCNIDVVKKVKLDGQPDSAYADSAEGPIGTKFDYRFDVSLGAGSQAMEVTDIHDVLGTQTGDPAFCGTISGPTKTGGDTDSLLEAGEHWFYTCSYTGASGDPARSPLHNTVFVTGEVPNCTSVIPGACGDTDSDSAEITVDKLRPTITTLLSDDSITVGDSIHDTATLHGATSDAGGTVTYTVYTNNTCTSGARAAGTVTVTNGVVPNSNTLQFTQAGDYYWQAVYSGDSNNVGATSTCTSEHLVVGKAQPTITTLLSDDEITVGDSIHDTATLHGATPDAGGTVTYTVYTNNTCTSGARAAGTVTVTNGVVPNSNTLQFTQAGDYYWQAVYSGDSNNVGATSACTSEHLIVHKIQPTITTLLSDDSITVGDSIHDTATLHGATPDAGGTVTYTVYTDTACSQGARAAGTVTVTNGVVPNSNTLEFDSAGDYYWQAHYSGDSNNLQATSACTSEHLVVNRAKPAVHTQVSSARIGLGHSVTDAATLSGGFNATGTVTFTVYKTDAETPVCSENTLVATFADVAQNEDGSWSSPSFTPDSVGHYEFIASYSGDHNNEPATGSCGDAGEAVDVVSVIVIVTKDPDQDHAYDGDQITFTIKATNSGTDSLANVELVDHIVGTDHTCESVSGPAGDDGNGTLDPGETWTYGCTVTVVHTEENTQHQIVNTAHIEGTTTTGGDHVTSNEDTAEVPVFHPAIAIDKTGPSTGQAGDKIGYTLSVTNPGDEAFAESTVKVTDAQCNGDPVTLIGKGGDPTPDTLDPGDVWTYSCSVQTAVGDTAVHNVASVEGSDKFGKTVTATDSADTTLSQPAQLVLPERVTPGSAKLLAPTGCVARAFNARVRGTKIAKVVFFLDGKKLKTLSQPNKKGLFQVRINPNRLKIGVHRLVANVTFQSGSGTKPKTIRLSFQRCAKRLVAPRFTG